MSKQFGFIVDTNEYSGNFEREMCAFMTGHIGDCGVGEKEAEEYKEIYEPLIGVEQIEDEHHHDVYRPVAIITTPNVWNNGLGFHFVDGQEEEALRAYQKYVKEEKEKWINITEGHRGKSVPTWTDEAIDKAVACYKKEIEDAMNKTEVEKYPAYQSVLIYFEDVPTEETIEFLKKRAYEYAEQYKRIKLEITGFRIYEKEVIIKEKTKIV